MFCLASETKNLKSQQGFFLECNELELWKVAQELSIYFGKNVIVYKDCKNQKISCNLRELSLEKALNIISWMSGIEWYEKDGFYYIGGNKDYIEVLDNTGIDSNSLNVFGPQVKTCEDKIIISGSERDVKRIRKAIETMQKRSAVNIRIWGYEIADSADLKLGFDIEQAIKYSASWDALMQYEFNPVQVLVMSIEASFERDANRDDMKQILNTCLTCISGKEQKIIVGEAVDRQTYAVSGNSEATYVSGYSTLQTGFTLKLKPYKYNNKWLFNVSIENSLEQSELRRNNIALENTVIASKKPSLIGRIIKDYETVSYEKGIPFLCDLPLIGYLFRVTEEKKVRRNVLFFMQVIDSEYLLPPGATRRAHLLTGATGMRNFLNSLPEKIGKLLKD
jgi:type II secretory pathway component GspD/PulD (secretin)